MTLSTLMIIFSWAATALVLIAFIVNARKYHRLAVWLWIIGDILWIIFDIYIANFSHLVLSSVIIFINLYAIYNLKKNGPS